MARMGLAVFAVVLAAVLVLGCLNAPEETTSSTLKGVNPTSPKQTTPTTQAPSTTLNKNVQEFKDAVASSDVTKCETLQDARLKDICVRDVAVAKGDAAMCGTVQTASLKDLCYYKIAIAKSDKGLCSSIQTDQVKTQCEAKATPK